MLALIPAGVILAMALAWWLIRRARAASERVLKEAFGRISDKKHDMSRVVS